MKLAAVTDEISIDPHAAVYIGVKQFGIRHYELRMMPDGRVPDISEQTVDRLVGLKEKYGISYSAISAGLFKCEPVAEKMEHELRVRLEACIALAKRLDVSLITGFALIDHHRHRPAELFERAVPYFQQACERLAEVQMTFAVETEFMSGCETAAEARRMIERTGPRLKVNWDPANAWIAGELPLEGYVHVRGHLANVHVKDADTRDWRLRNPFVPLGDGKVPWQPVLDVLTRDRTAPMLTVETHVEPLIPNTEKGVSVLRKMLQNAEAGRDLSC